MTAKLSITINLDESFWNIWNEKERMCFNFECVNILIKGCDNQSVT